MLGTETLFWSNSYMVNSFVRRRALSFSSSLLGLSPVCIILGLVAQAVHLDEVELVDKEVVSAQESH